MAVPDGRRSGFTPDIFICRSPVGHEARPTSAQKTGRKACPRGIGIRDRTSPLSLSRAFTLFELLAVLAIIALLSALAFGGGQSAIENGKRLRAQAELAALSTALESYKREFGDYPQTGTTAEFLQALIGKRGPTGAAVTARCRLDLDRFRVSGNRDPLADVSVELLDPWERSYVYAYKTSGMWSNPSYVLFSAGKDGQFAAIPSTGIVDSAAAENLDNLSTTP